MEEAGQKGQNDGELPNFAEMFIRIGEKLGEKRGEERGERAVTAKSAAELFG